MNCIALQAASTTMRDRPLNVLENLRIPQPRARKPSAYRSFLLFLILVTVAVIHIAITSAVVVVALAVVVSFLSFVFYHRYCNDEY